MALKLVDNHIENKTPIKHIKHKHQKISFLIILTVIVLGSFVFSSILTGNFFLSILIAVISAVGFSTLTLPAFVLYNIFFTENYNQTCDPH